MEVLARHVAHLFARDPLVIYKDRVMLDDRVDVDHWENIRQSQRHQKRFHLYDSQKAAPAPPFQGR